MTISEAKNCIYKQGAICTMQKVHNVKCEFFDKKNKYCSVDKLKMQLDSKIDEKTKKAGDEIANYFNRI